MRDAKINQSLVYYATYGEGETKDEWGNDIKSYSQPIKAYLSLSSNRGDNSVDIWGKDLAYDREMITHNMKCPIDEYTHLWIGVEPTEDYNYVVKKVAASLNCIRYAIKRVDVDNG